MIRSLISDGAARPDMQHIGLDIADDCHLRDSTGTRSERLLAIGPLTRGRFFEIEAIPDIRLQAQQIASRLLGDEDLVARIERR